LISANPTAWASLAHTKTNQPSIDRLEAQCAPNGCLH